MNDLFRFFRSREAADPQLEMEFRRVYQEPSLRYMRFAFLFGFVGFGAFFLMDHLFRTTPAIGAVPFVRSVILLLFAAAFAVTYWTPQFFARNYTAVINAFSVLGVLGAALLPIAVHGHRSTADVYWSVNSSMTTAVMVTYGLNRLTARNTAAIVVPGCLVGVFSVLLLPAFDAYAFGRLLVHLTIANAIAFYFRSAIERRERQLFLLARENLSRNIYAKELELARAQAEEGNEIKLRFLANMSHEFRTPMTGILHTLELVSRTAGRDTLQLIDRARASGRALLATLNSILEYTTWTQKMPEADRTVVSLSATVRELVERFRPEARERGLDLVLRIDLASSEDAVSMDKVKVDRALECLLENALRFTDKGSVRVNVELGTQRGLPYPAAHVLVAISDTGIGIAPDLSAAVFEPFYQVDSASTRTVGGTGLGLSIARRLGEAMGGSVSLASEAGVGTTVELRFPTVIARNSAPRSARSERTGNRGPFPVDRLQGTVLLVEDNEFNAALVLELLTAMGVVVTHASDGDQAHREALARHFDCILMDCQLPKIDGYESTRRIRESEAASGAAHVPIIALTANALSGDREKCLQAGMDDYLAKPYTAGQLHAMLAAWLPRAAIVDRDAGEASAAPTVGSRAR